MSVTQQRPRHDGTAPAGALTTVFTPPATCTENLSIYYKESSCMPEPERWRLYWGAASFYSPGICPSGMVSITTVPPFFGPPIEPDETGMVCCPSGYSLYASSNEHRCAGFTSTSDYSVVDVPLTITTSNTVVTESDRTREYYQTSSANSVYPIQVRWRESDLAVLETYPLSPGVTPTMFGNSGGSEADKEAGDNASGRKHGLSGGATAGIVVGVVTFVAALGVTIIMLRRRRKRHQSSRSVSKDTPSTNPLHEKYITDRPIPDPQGTRSFPLSRDEDGNDELGRIADRRARLLELERLDVEEAHIRNQAGPGPNTGITELSCESSAQGPVELGDENKW